MGADGGSIPTRDDMVTVSKVQKSQRRTAQDFGLCHLTQLPLEEPVCACGLGHLYNKESVLECLLGKGRPLSMQHIRGLKDITTCHITISDGIVTCPLSGAIANGVQQFVMCRPCGCILSKRALPQDGQETACVQCDLSLAPHPEDRYLALFPTTESDHNKAEQRWKEFKERRRQARPQKRKR